MKFSGIALLAVTLTVSAALMLGGCGPGEDTVSPSPTVESNEPSAEPTPEKIYETVLIGTAVDIDSHLNIRSTPNTTGEIIGKARNGDKFTVLEANVEGGDWHRITYEGMVAYVSAKYVVVEAMELEVVPTAMPNFTQPEPENEFDPDDPENPDLQNDGDHE